jgi:hypothetical protein
MPIRKDQYPARNDPSHNHGYEYLRANPAVRKKLAAVANDLGIPSVWLADVIDYESSWNHRSINTRSGAAGLYQMMPVRAADLGITVTDFYNSSPVQQLEVLRRDLKRYQGKINTIEDLYILIQAPAYIDASPAERANVSDGKTFKQHMLDMGDKAGRSYNTSYSKAQAIHSRYKNSCSMCRQMAAGSGDVQPHYGRTA